MIELNFVFRRGGSDLREFPMREIDAAVSELSNGIVVSDHEDGVAFAMKLAKQADDGFLVGLVEIAGGLVGKDELGMVDERASHGDALLLATGKLRGKVGDAVGESDAGEGGASFVFVRSAMEILREHDVFE